MEWIATAAYGLEGVLAQELRDLGLSVGETQTSRVQFTGSALDGCRANVFLRTAGRVRLVVGRFPAPNFDALFEGVRSLPWEEILPEDAAFPVTGRCVNSQLMSVPNCQAIVKKAIATRMGQAAGRSWLPETGTIYPIEVHIWKDQATISLDTSGTPLHRRGYRELNGPAALRETLAAALVRLSRWDASRPLWDPCCGTGTLAVEAALQARQIAPGISRSFGGEAYPLLPASLWRQAREEAMDGMLYTLPLDITASDIDPEALSMARHHARKAGVATAIRFRRMDAAELASDTAYGHILTNPPSGERLGAREQAQLLYQQLGQAWRRLDGWSCHVITAHPRFESYFGARAHHRRALYNGPLACRFYQYFGPKPRREVQP